MNTFSLAMEEGRDGTGTGLDFRLAGLPVTGRPVCTGRPARVLTLKFCFFHVKMYKTSVGSQEYLPDNI
jgi:hypothetical protein